ncbi:hypothetical protein JKP88DRAFT_195619 [Tribonema minus]|uniref:GDT1 family protein n=1 Tax=Tribonema minus TaxID=303371 RepID=A0A836CPU7_9STRA|nr:hypothetical protein JKP88DRAFT_195619 [Tribonema minus]
MLLALGVVCLASTVLAFGPMQAVKAPTTMTCSGRACTAAGTTMVWSPLAKTWRRAAKSYFLSGGGPAQQQRQPVAAAKGSARSAAALSRRVGAQLSGVFLVAAVALLSHALPAAAAAAVTAGAPLTGAIADGTLTEATSNGFVQAFSLVFVSEIGDKTFFIAGLLAAKTSRLISFAGSIAALSVMTVLSCLIGVAFHSVPSTLTNGIPFDDYIAVAAFLYFGLVTLRDASQIPDDDNSGMEAEAAEAEESVKELSEGTKGGKAGAPSTLALIAQTFGLVFAAEFGDRSFLTTIALSAAQNPISVAGGAIAAHASATGIAVMGGALLSQYISEKLVGYIGGTLFIIFAITTALGLF